MPAVQSSCRAAPVGSGITACVVAIIVLASCASSRAVRTAPSPSLREESGVPSDMRTLPGTYDGYDVFRGCKDGSGQNTLVVVMGTGTVEFPWLAKGFDDRGNLDHELMEQFRGQATATAVPFIHSTGFGFACRGEKLAFHMSLADWRKVDGVVERLGRWLHQNDYRGEIVVDISPVPVLL